MLPILLSLVSCAAIAAPQGEPGTSITIYSSAQPGAMSVNALQQAQNPYSYNPYNANIPGYALVRLERDVDLPKDRSNIQLTDVAAQIDATTVTFASLSDPAGTRVLEQSFQSDVVSMAKLLERYLDKRWDSSAPWGRPPSPSRGPSSARPAATSSGRTTAR